MAIVGSYGLGFFCRGMLLIFLAGAAAASTVPDSDTKSVAAMHGAPVIGTLPVPLMERRALRTTDISGNGRQHSTIGQDASTTADTKDVAAMHREPVTGTLSVPLMERMALRTKDVTGSTGRQQPHGQRRQHHSDNGEDTSSSTRFTPTSSSRSILDESLSTSSSLRHPLCEQIEISESYLSGSESTLSSHPLGNVIDGDLGTRWATEGFASWLMIDLPEPTLLAGVAIDFGHKSSSQSFTMLVLGDYQVIHRPEVNAEPMEGLEYMEFEREIPARSVVLVGYGREGYTSLAEIQLCGARVEAAAIAAASVSSRRDGDRYRSSNRRTNKHLRGGKRT